MSKIKAFTMPKWGIEMQEGTISEWVVQEGKPFKKGDIIALIETDKISKEVEADNDGVLRKIVSPAGEVQPVGTLLGVFADEATSDDEIVAFVDNFKKADTSTALGAGTNDEAASAPAETASEAPPQRRRLNSMCRQTI